MAVHYIKDTTQGTQEWLDKRGQYITGTDAYTFLRGASKEQILKNKQEARSFHGNFYTRRGHILEDEGIHLYEILNNLEVKHCELMLNDDYPDIAGSPDGLVKRSGLVEHKAFNEKRHLANYEVLEPQIYCQINWYMFVSERKWCDMIFYNPDIEDPAKCLLIKRYPRDEDLINQFKERLKDGKNN